MMVMDTGEVAAVSEIPDEVQRWTAKRRAALLLCIIKGETSVGEAARKHGLTLAEIERWREQLLSAGEKALRAPPQTRGGRQGRADSQAAAQGR
jgi:transposase-like protein